jgi:hypothetical protein
MPALRGLLEDGAVESWGKGKGKRYRLKQQAEKKRQR